MKKQERSENQKKIAAALGKIYKDVVAYKKKMNSELVVSVDGKIVRIKPEDFK